MFRTITAAGRLKDSRTGARGWVQGQARLGKVTKVLAARLGPGDIAVIDHCDLDQLAAEALLQAGVRCVINSGTSLSGRYPAQGAAILVGAGVTVVDQVDQAVFTHLRDGDRIAVDPGTGAVHHRGRLVARGQVLTPEGVSRQLQAARQTLPGELERFLENTLAYARREKDLFLGPIPLPPLRTSFRDRHVLVVVRGPGYKEDLRMLANYIRDAKPVLVAVDGAADALLEAGRRPHVIIGDMDSVSDTALSSGAELVVHAYPGGHAPGRERLLRLGLPGHIFPAPGTSEDAAMLLAAEAGARLIVAVGTHTHAVDFLDKGRAGMASTLLTRLKLGGRLVDAKGVSKLYAGQDQARYVPLLVAAALASAGSVMMSAPWARGLVKVVWLRLRLALGL